MYKSKTNKFKNIFLELTAWLYAILITFLSMSVGLVVWHDYTVWDSVTMGLDKIAKLYPDINFSHIKMTSLVIAKV